ncbi:MAG: energy transducer TonB [Steroidobacteraceae bacterium]
MQDQLRGLLDNPSRVAGWTVVVLVHVLIWQMLCSGLNFFSLLPTLDPVHVSLLHEDLPPVVPQQPPAPELMAPQVQAVFVPTPEVKVAQEAAVVLQATSVVPPPVAAEAVAVMAPAESPPTRLLMVSESDVDYLVKPEVRYPSAAKRARERGMVLLSVVLNERGLVDYINVYQSSGYQRLDEAAVRAVRSLRIKPYMKNGRALPIEVRVPVEFS